MQELSQQTQRPALFEPTHVGNPVRVNAVTILAVSENADSGELALRLSDGRNYVCDTAMTVRYYPEVGDYLVTQEDGYEYLNPKNVFERKYSDIATHKKAEVGKLTRAEPDQQRVRAQALEMALRTAGVNGYKEVVEAAKGYMDYINGQQQ